MFSSILKIIPKLDASSLAQMEKQLGSRFARIAKSFGRGIINIFKGGGWLGAAMVLIDKILNPLKEVNDAIDRMLQASDQVVTNSAHFNTTAGRLLKLSTIAKSAGLTEDSLFMAMNKYQSAVAEAKQDPTRPSAVRNFVGIEDTAEGFFEFIQSLQKMSSNDRQIIQNEVFGEKQILKMAEFLQLDLGKRYAELGFNKISTGKLTANEEKLAGLEDYQAILQGKTSIQDRFSKGQIINKGMIEAQNEQEKRRLKIENNNLANYHNLAKVAKASDVIIESIQKITITLTTIAVDIGTLLSKVQKTRFWRFLGLGDAPKNGTTKELDPSWQNPDPYSGK